MNEIYFFIYFVPAPYPSQHIPPKKLIPVLDTSCFHSTTNPVAAPLIENALLPKYLRRNKKRKEKHHHIVRKFGKNNPRAAAYLVAIYECENGFAFEEDSPEAMFCSLKKWIGKEPRCIVYEEEATTGT